jgi:predicted HTH transcriptional regulator
MKNTCGTNAMTSELPINLENLLRQRQVEGERIEYKAGWNPDAILRTLCAFANDFENLGGGYVVIGQDCDANGRPVFPPVGVPEDQLDKIQRELESTAGETTQETTQEKILALLRENPATTRIALAKAIGITPDGVKYHLDKLKAAGKIRHHGPTKAGQWEVTGK